MAERDLMDWIRIILMTAYMGIVTTIFIIGLFESLFIIFFILVLAWIIPFVILMATGEWIKTRTLPFYIAIVGFAVIAGLYFGYSSFFYDEDILLGIFTTALYGIMIAYIVLRYLDTDSPRQASTLLMPVIAVIGGAILIVSGIEPIASTPYLVLPFTAIGGMCIAITLLFGFYSVYSKRRAASLTDGYACTTVYELKECHREGTIGKTTAEVEVKWEDPRATPQCNKPFTKQDDEALAKAEAKKLTGCQIKNRKAG